jgi:hypothetical protein
MSRAALNFLLVSSQATTSPEKPDPLGVVAVALPLYQLRSRESRGSDEVLKSFLLSLFGKDFIKK